jgi:hypothetical protein
MPSIEMSTVTTPRGLIAPAASGPWNTAEYVVISVLPAPASKYGSLHGDRQAVEARVRQQGPLELAGHALVGA